MSAVQVSNATEVGTKLVELCRKGGFQEAIETLYAEDIVSVEAMEMPDGTREHQGIEAIKAKNQWWAENHEVHGVEVRGPFAHDDRFMVHFSMDVTPKYTGERIQSEEVGLYTVRDGKVAREEFFYAG